MRTLLIDADSECYAAACAAERHRVIGLRAEELGPPRFLGPFDTKKELTAAIAEGEQVTPFRSDEINTEESAILLVDARLRRVVYQAQEKYGEVHPELYLSGKLNYRHFIDHTYKGTREATQRPYWLARLKDHVRNHWRAKITATWEADDEIGIRASELGADNYIVCSVDKDLRQIPGRHIIINKAHLNMTPAGATLRLYAQILAGDPTDNIKGCLSEKRADWQMSYDSAFTFLEPFVDGGPRALWAAVVARYQAMLDKWGSDACRYTNARGAALHTAQLVYILRDRPEGQLPRRWTPPEE